jgi:hypothetical protein
VRPHDTHLVLCSPLALEADPSNHEVACGRSVPNARLRTHDWTAASCVSCLRIGAEKARSGSKTRGQYLNLIGSYVANGRHVPHVPIPLEELAAEPQSKGRVKLGAAPRR